MQPSVLQQNNDVTPNKSQSQKTIHFFEIYTQLIKETI